MKNLKKIRSIARKHVKAARLHQVEEDLDMSLVEALQELMNIFDKSDSWFERAVVRVLLGVKKLGRCWVVPGLHQLGDYYPHYVVCKYGDKYVCDCFGRKYGTVRKKKICTHIAAVILARRQRKINEFS